MVAAKGEKVVAVLLVAVSMFWWNSSGNSHGNGNGRRGKGSVFLVEGSNGGGLVGNGGGGGGFWRTLAPSHFGIAVAVTAMAGIALAATIIYSRRVSLKSPWSQRRRKSALSPQQWKNLFSPDGKLCDGGVKFLKIVRGGGVDPSIRNEVWPFLLAVYDLNTTQEERDSIRTEKRKDYENLRRQCTRLLKRSDSSLNLKETSGTNSNGDCGSVIQDMDSPHLDVSTRESLSADGESLECEDSALQISHVVSNATNSQVSEDDDQSEITCADADPDASIAVTKSSDSDSGEEHESMQTSPIAREIERDDFNKHTKEDSSSVSDAEGKHKVHEDFDTWQRIIRLDAVRANGEWIPYSPVQAAVSDEKARHLAKAVGLKDYEHLEPCRIFHAARLVAILEAYALYDPEIGYCQGMSDLLCPIIAVIEEDHDAFWCFVGFMRKARHNFRLDEVGIRRQLNIVSKIIRSKDSKFYRHLEKLQADDCCFVYRMVVVLFRRELAFEQTLCLWEVMWADQAAIRAGIGWSAWGSIRRGAPPPTDDLLLYAIAACVLQKRKLIIETYSSVDEIMKECNSMAGHLDVWKLLDDAHELVVSLHDKI